MPSYFRFAWLGIGLAMLGTPSVAGAQLEPCSIDPDSPTTSLSFTCRPFQACSSADVCSSDGFTQCSPPLSVDGSTTGTCRPACSTILACHPGDPPPACPTISIGGTRSTGVCVPYAGIIGDLGGICVWTAPVDITYCLTDSFGTVGPEQLALCHTRPDGVMTSNYREGDCDGDGCPNGLDPNPCADDACGRCLDTPAVVEDACPIAFEPPICPDAGNAGLDAGPPQQDDGGPIPEVDSGSNGDLDGGPRPLDPGVGFNGGGGCRCSTPGSGAPASGAIAMAALVLATIRRRRR